MPKLTIKEQLLAIRGSVKRTQPKVFKVAKKTAQKKKTSALHTFSRPGAANRRFNSYSYAVAK